MRLGLGLGFMGFASASRLSLSPSSATAGTAYSGTISGNVGTTSATSSDGTVLTVIGSTLSGTFTNPGAIIITITDTLGSVLVSFTVATSGFSPSLDFSDAR